VIDRKMRYFTKESAVDFGDVEEALALVKEVCIFNVREDILWDIFSSSKKSIFFNDQRVNLFNKNHL
jgi:hypothetical protein